MAQKGTDRIPIARIEECYPRDTTGKTLPLFRSRAKCPVPFAKIFIFPKFKIMIKRTHPALTTEGVSRSPRCVVRGVMDAILPQGVRKKRVRSSRVVLIPRRWDQV